MTTDPLRPVPNVDASLASPATALLGVSPTALTDDLGTRPVAVVNVVLVMHDTDQAVDVASLDEATLVPVPHRSGSDHFHGEEVAPTPSDHRNNSGFSDPPAGILGIRQQATLEPTIMPRQKPTPNLRTATALAEPLHTFILTRPCLGVKI